MIIDDLREGRVYAWNAESKNDFFDRYSYDQIWLDKLLLASNAKSENLNLLSIYDLMRNELESEGIEVVYFDDFYNKHDFIWDDLKNREEFVLAKHGAKCDVENAFRLWEYVKGMRRKN